MWQVPLSKPNSSPLPCPTSWCMVPQISYPSPHWGPSHYLICSMPSTPSTVTFEISCYSSAIFLWQDPFLGFMLLLFCCYSHGVFVIECVCYYQCIKAGMAECMQYLCQCANLGCSSPTKNIINSNYQQGAWEDPEEKCMVLGAILVIFIGTTLWPEEDIF